MTPAEDATKVEIVKPHDWAVVETPCLTVVIRGTLDGTEECRLVPRADWIAGRHHAFATHATAEFSSFAPRNAWASIAALPGLLGPFIITVVRRDGSIVAASGIILGRSSNTPLRFHPLDEGGSAACAPVFPLEQIEFEGSGLRGFGKEVAIPSLDRQEFFSLDTAPTLTVALLEGSAPFDAADALQIESCHGVHLTRFQSLAAASAWSSASSYFLMVREGIADLRNGIVLTRDGLVWSDSMVGSLFGDNQALSMPDYVAADGRFGWVGANSMVSFDDQRAACVFVHKASLVNHAHWLMNSLVAVFTILPELVDGSVALIAPPLSDKLRDVLIRMGVPGTALIEIDAPYVQCRRLVFPSPLSTRANMHPSPSCLPFFEHLKTAFSRSYSDPMPELVVFTRAGFASARRMENEPELVSALQSLGFTPIAPHELTMEEEVNVLSRARIIVSQLGAALCNMAFAPPGCTIIEVGTSNYTSNEYLYMAKLLDQEFIRVMVEPDTEGFVSAGAFVFRAPVAEIVEIVSKRLDQLR